MPVVAARLFFARVVNRSVYTRECEERLQQTRSSTVEGVETRRWSWIRTDVLLATRSGE